LSTILIHGTLGNLLLKIVEKAANKDIGIQSVKTAKTLDGQSIETTIMVHDLEELTRFMNDIKSIEEVKDVERLFL